MIKGKVGQKSVRHIEMLYSSPRISPETVKRSIARERNGAVAAIQKSFITGLKNISRIQMRLANARTPKQREYILEQLKQANHRLDEIEARKKKIEAIARKANS